MKKLLTFLLAFSFTSLAEASSIDGIYLKKLIGKWLDSNDQKSNVEILDDIKYADCDENDIFIKDISGLFRLLKVSCLGPNKWSFITRNKQDYKPSKIKKRSNVNVLALRDGKKSGTIISENDIIVIKKKVRNVNDLVVEKKDIIGKRLKKSISSNRPIYHSNLEKDWLIQKNTSVIIENSVGGIIIKDQGLALENADYMDIVKVKNIKSGKVIIGFAKNKKKVVLKTKQFWISVVIY